MSWYLTPPKGTVPIHKLEEYATKRLQFLLRLIACRNNQDVDDVLQDANVVNQSDCLITNTAKDEISHYIIRLTLGGDHESMSFFTDSELALFKLRIERMVVNEWIVFFKSADRFFHKLQGTVLTVQCRALSDLMLVFDTLKQKFDSWHQLSAEMCSSESTGVTVNLPFHLVLSLIARRCVNMYKGIAVVPVVLMKDVFIEHFEKLMIAAAVQANARREVLLQDERIKQLAVILKRAFRSETKPPIHHPQQFPALQLSEFWSNSFMFPPCMANIVRVLQEKHRLKHHDRIQLTLFLKELGLSLNDALLLWKREYSVPISSSNISCQHGWKNNERRYIYNIRHLYGLEGSRIDYRAHGCSAIQGRTLSCGDAGGCPFISSDMGTLHSMFNDHGLDKTNADHLTELCRQKQYGYVCQRFMIHKIQERLKCTSSRTKVEKEVQKARMKLISVSSLIDKNIRMDKGNCYNKSVTNGGNIEFCLNKRTRSEIPLGDAVMCSGSLSNTSAGLNKRRCTTFVNNVSSLVSESFDNLNKDKHITFNSSLSNVIPGSNESKILLHGHNCMFKADWNHNYHRKVLLLEDSACMPDKNSISKKRTKGILLDDSTSRPYKCTIPWKHRINIGLNNIHLNIKSNKIDDSSVSDNMPVCKSLCYSVVHYHTGSQNDTKYESLRLPTTDISLEVMNPTKDECKSPTTSSAGSDCECPISECSCPITSELKCPTTNRCISVTGSECRSPTASDCKYPTSEWSCPTTSEFKCSTISQSRSATGNDCISPAASDPRCPTTNKIRGPTISECRSMNHKKELNGYKRKKFLFKLKNKNPLTEHSQKRIYLKDNFDTSISVPVSPSTTSEHKAICPDRQFANHKNGTLIIKQTEMVPGTISSEKRMSLLQGSCRSACKTQFNNCFPHRTKNGSLLNSVTENKQDSVSFDVTICASGLLEVCDMLTNYVQSCSGDEINISHHNTNDKVKLNCGHSQWAVEVSSERRSTGLSQTQSGCKHSCESNLCCFCKCYSVNIAGGRSQGRRLLNSSFDSSVLIRKPGDVYWFCRKHLC